MTLDPFEFDFVFPAVLEQLTPTAGVYETGTFTGSGDGDVTGNVIPVDIDLTRPRASTSGCEAADFAGLDFGGPNDIALIQRGTCHVRRQGRQRPGRRRRGRGHLQPGQRARRARA